jgi:copper(I)-binding protein
LGRYRFQFLSEDYAMPQGVPLLAILRAIVLSICFISSGAVTAAGIMVKEGWSLPLPPTSPNGAVYLTIHNHGEMDKLISATSPRAEKVEFHTIVHENDLMKMHRLESIEVPMHGQVEFTPGVLHVMLMGLTEPLVDGQHFPLLLMFEKFGEVEVMVNITESAGGSMDHSSHSTSSSSAE